MKPETLRYILSGLRKFQLTEAEKEFIHFAESNLNRSNPLSEMMGLILERIYRQRTAFIRDSVISRLKQDTAVSPSVHVPNHQNETVGAKL